MSSLIKKPRPTAERIETSAGNPRQHRAANSEPPTPTGDLLEIGLEKRLEAVFAWGTGRDLCVGEGGHGNNSGETDKKSLNSVHAGCFL
jgi:hypothetical protein